MQTITLSALGRNISKAIQMTEILKARIGFLHQENSFVTTSLPIRNQENKEDSKLGDNQEIKK